MSARRSHHLKFDVLEDRTVPALLAGELHLNSTTVGLQTYSAVAMSPTGASVAVWASYNASGVGSDIYFQRLAANGSKVGSEIQLTNTGGYEFEPKVCMDDAGKFVIAWTVVYSTGNRNLQFARFDAAGVLQGTIKTVAWTPEREFYPSIACSAAGEFVITYTRETTASNPDIVAKRYSSAGDLLQTIQVANSSAKEQTAQVARSHGSNAVFDVIYQTGFDISLKRYSATGGLLGTTIIANTSRTEAYPAIAMDNAGNAVTAWQVWKPLGENYTNGWWVQIRRLTKDGTLGPAFLNRSPNFSDGLPYGADEMTAPQVAMNPLTGDFAATVAYIAIEPDPMFPINFRAVTVTQYKANGSLASRHTAAGYDVQEVTPKGPVRPAIASSRNGTYLVTYSIPSNLDPSDGIFARRGTF